MHSVVNHRTRYAVYYAIGRVTLQHTKKLHCTGGDCVHQELDTGRQ
jgi:hypothetical protein